MNPGNHQPRDGDDPGNMIGGYASGNLSPQEQEKLFEAALHDQHLFDALMDEQALKDYLEQPGVKAELLEALQPKPTLWRRLRHWLTSPASYAAAGTLAAAAVLVVVVLNRPSSHQATVEVAKPPLPMVTEPVTPAIPAPPPAAEREPAPAPAKRKDMVAPPAQRRNVSQTPIPQQYPEESRQSGPAASRLSDKQEQASRRDEAQQSLPANAPAAAGGLAGGVIGGVAPAPAPPVIEQPLSLSYTLLRRDPEGRYSPVTTSTVAARDSLRLEVTPNHDGIVSLYSRNEAGLETLILKGMPLSRGQTAAVPPSGGFSAAGSTKLVLVFRRREAASDSKELAAQAFRQRAGSVEKDKTGPPAAAASAPLAREAVPDGLNRVSASSPAAREVSVEIAIRAGAN
ncbi:MAG: hypothetical protein IT167_17815 [Bryobacterales bacterium]|nr:hypothetical protein [Bryobacterales bacterium]